MKNYFSYLYLRSFLTLLLLSVLPDVADCQNTGAANLQSSFEGYRTTSLQEKVYVHTDKLFYLAGETLWFKIYNVDASFHMPINVSKVAYIELLDSEQRPVFKTKAALSEGTGSGSVLLPDDIASGNYIFRAYTNWMKNFGADFYYQKAITLLNTLHEVLPRETVVDSLATDIQFFPEGGNLVNGLRSRIGFRGTNFTGRGINFEGVIVDQENDTVARFRPLVFGIGSFEFVPQKDKRYKAVLRYSNNQTTTKELPIAQAGGYVLTLVDKKDLLEVSVQSSADLENMPVHLFVHTRNAIKENSSASIRNSSASFNVEKQKLGDGISHITLFNSQMQPVCERLYFKRPTKNLLIEATTDKKLYRTRDKILLDMRVFNELRQEQTANLSMAVYKMDSARTDDEDIASYLLLSSDLKGTVESPAYYSGSGEEVQQAANNLMLTHGWRRFSWDNVLKKTHDVYEHLPELEGPIITGRVNTAHSGKSASEAMAFLSIPGRTSFFHTATSNDSGRVRFFSKEFYGAKEVVAQASGAAGKLRIEIETPFSEKTSSIQVPPFSTSQFVTDGLQTRSVNMQVQNVHIAAKSRLFEQVPLDTLPFYGKPTKRYTLDDYVRFPTMEEVLREYVTEINVFRPQRNYSIALIKRHPSNIVEKKNPLVLVDGVPVFDLNKLFLYDPLKVRDLEIVNNNYYLGKSTFDGVASFRTYTGRPEGLETDPDATIIDFEGLQLRREFYSPVYDTEVKRSSRLPDFRSLISWQPELKFANNQKQQLSFYSSDLAGRYMVVIQGISPTGRAGSTVLHFDVLPNQ
ncbi:MAG TPA: hypothetical protein VEZ55_01940 [Chitinophagaceae bacterium]|nr:hypothetical protein [Chitinophagaceae bacterium]